jgi:predicted RNA-binding Zn ribbon-like protein
MSLNSPTPADAALVRDFVNSVDWQDDVEAWQVPADLEQWFAAKTGVSVRGLSDADLTLALRMREGLRSVLLSHAGHDPLPAVLGDFELALAEIPMRMRVESTGEFVLAPAEPRMAAGLGIILAAIDRLRAEGTWDRLKACSRDSCRWAYWDISSNRSGRWCSMAICGNYIKMRRRNNPGQLLSDVMPEAGGPTRAPTVVDVAALAGVSIGTVSRVVTGAANVAVPTQQRVRAAIETLGYRPNLTARALRTGHPVDLA